MLGSNPTFSSPRVGESNEDPVVPGVASAASHSGPESLFPRSGWNISGNMCQEGPGYPIPYGLQEKAEETSLLESHTQEEHYTPDGSVYCRRNLDPNSPETGLFVTATLGDRQTTPKQKYVSLKSCLLTLKN